MIDLAVLGFESRVLWAGQVLSIESILFCVFFFLQWLWWEGYHHRPCRSCLAEEDSHGRVRLDSVALRRLGWVNSTDVLSLFSSFLSFFVDWSPSPFPCSFHNLTPLTGDSTQLCLSSLCSFLHSLNLKLPSLVLDTNFSYQTVLPSWKKENNYSPLSLISMTFSEIISLIQQMFMELTTCQVPLEKTKI